MTAMSPQIDQLVSAINAIMREVPVVGKSSEANAGGRFRYTSDAEFLCSFQPAMVRNGIVIAPQQTVTEHTEFKTSRGTAMQMTHVRVTYLIAHTSGQWMTAEVAGSGSDSTDKAVYKALTGAFKYVLRQTFAVPTGDDAEKTVAQREQSERRQKRHQDAPIAQPSRRPQTEERRADDAMQADQADAQGMNDRLRNAFHELVAEPMCSDVERLRRSNATLAKWLDDGMPPELFGNAAFEVLGMHQLSPGQIAVAMKKLRGDGGKSARAEVWKRLGPVEQWINRHEFSF